MSDPFQDDNRNRQFVSPKKKGIGPWGWTIIGVLFFGTILFLVFYTPPLRFGPHTTRFTGPLTKDGRQIHYLRILESRIYPPEMKTDENGFRVFLRTFGDYGGLEISDLTEREQYRLQKYAKLDLDPDEPPLMAFPEEPTTMFETLYPDGEGRREMIDALTKRISKPWTTDEVPELIGWFQMVDIPLDVAAETLKKPVFTIPLLEDPAALAIDKPTNMLMILLPDFQRSRILCRSFCARANNRVARGDIDGAIDDALACMRLGRHLTYHDILVASLVGMAAESMGLSIPIAGNEEHPPSPRQLRRLLAEIGALRPRCPISGAFEGERLMGLSTIQAVLNGDGSTFDVTPTAARSIAVSCDQNVLYHEINEGYDKLIAGVPEEEIYQRPDVKQILGGITSQGRARLIATLFKALLFPAVQAASEAERRTVCMVQMRRIAIALRLYEIEHDKLPGNNWQEAIRPYFLAEGEPFPVCPSAVHHGIPEGKTTYALVRYPEEEQPGLETFLLVELSSPIDPEEAEVTPEQVLEGIGRSGTLGSRHSGGCNGVTRDLSTRFFSETTEPVELHRLVGRVMPEEAADEMQESENDAMIGDGEPPVQPEPSSTGEPAR